MKNNQAQPQYEEYRDDDSIEIDIVGIIKYLWPNVITILAIALIPLLFFVLYSMFKTQSDKDQYLAAVVKVNHRVSNLDPSAIVSESIIASVLEENAIKGDASKLVNLFDVVEGYEDMNERIRQSLSRLSGEVAAGRGEDIAAIERRYNNLLAGQDLFLTIYYNLEESPLSLVSARILMSGVIRKFNEEFAQGHILTEPTLSKLGMRVFEPLEAAMNPYTVQNLLGIVTSLKNKIDTLRSVQYDRVGFNPDVMKSQLSYLDLQTQRVISSSSDLQDYFYQELDMDISITTNNIIALNHALESIDSRQSGLGITEIGGVERGALSAEYSAELFERFLNLGAKVSLVAFQQDLLNQKLDLEFRRNRLEERKRIMDGNYRLSDPEGLYFTILAETKSLATDVNEHLKFYQDHYYRQLITPLKYQHLRPGQFFQPMVWGVVFVVSFVLTVLFFIIRRPFVGGERQIT